MIHPSTELKYIQKEIGYGVVATQYIPKGTITWVLDLLDRRLTKADVDALGQKYWDIIDTYCFRDASGDYILCWDHARFVNHSFHPNCITTAYDFEIAVRDIEPGEELTNDYGTLNVSRPFHCLPEPNSFREVVLPDDLLNYHGEWDNKLISAFQEILNVNQPLIKFIQETIQKKAIAIALGECEMDSIVSCYLSSEY